MMPRVLLILVFATIGVAIKGTWLSDVILPKKTEHDSPLEELCVNNPQLESFISDIPRMWNNLDRALYHQIMAPVMSIDTKETKTDYQVAVDLPGVTKENIKLILKGNDLTISAHKAGMMEENSASFRRIERFSGNISRVIALPENVNFTQIEAHSSNGVLHIRIPKIQHDVDQCTTTIEVH